MTAHPASAGSHNAQLIAAGIAAAQDYQTGVLEGSIVTGQLARLAVERNARDLEDAHHRGLVFDSDAAGRAIAFFGYLTHGKGQWSGQPIVLSPWQCWAIACVFGWKHAATGLRRFRTVYEEVARKNGKTTKLAGIGNRQLTKDGEGGPEVYAAATKREQARLVFDEARRMARESRQLGAMISVETHALRAAYNGVFKPLAADATTQDGLNPSTVLIDELHAHKSPALWNVLESGLGARLQPLLWAITTAGDLATGICYQKRDYAVKVLTQVFEDDSFFAVIYTLDVDDDWRDESCWIKANPNLGISVSLDYMRGRAKQAANDPDALPDFKTKNLNIWLSARGLWCDLEQWRTCARPYTLTTLLDREDIVAAFGGLDLANVSDITCLALVLVTRGGDWYTWSRHYLPEDAVKPRLLKSNIPFGRWADEGWLQLTPGNVTDYKWIEHDIAQIVEQVPLVDIGFDRWNSSQVVTNLLDAGVDMVEFGQGWASMNLPMKELQRRYLAGTIYHPDDPVLNWSMSNVVAKKDPAGNIKPDKQKSAEKIDPSVALIEAIGRALAAPESKPEPGIYF